MAGYKTSLIDDDAASLWTFDGDAFDSGSRKLIVPVGNPNVIIDEIDNLNPAILHNDHELYLGYRLGMPSLIAHEQTDQHSISFGYYGNQPSHPNGWAKAYLEIPHTISYAFPRFGSFSVEFVFNKQYGNDAGTNGYSSYSRPVISKSGVFDVYLNFPYSGPSTLTTVHPCGTSLINLYDFKGTFDLIGNTIHYVLTWDVVQENNGQYTGTTRIYINNYLAIEKSQIYYDVFPNTNLANPILIAGNAGNNRRTDWHTSSFQMDQIAIYDRVLTSDEVANHFSKIFPYDDMVRYEFCNNYWPFNDTDSTINFNVAPLVGSLSGKYIGTRNTQFFRGLDGPTNLLGAKASLFTEGGMASFIAKDTYNAYIPRQINSEYSYELWFSISSVRRGVILSAQELEYPFDGPLLQLNVLNNQDVPGSVQYTEGSNGRVFKSRYLNDNGQRLNYNDGKWHHCVVLRRVNGWVELWLDGVLHDSSIEATRTVDQPGQLIVMNSIPGFLNCNGAICKLAYYPYALFEHQIRSHYNYTITYRIRGVVTLLGVPYQATLRFYNSYTGQLIQELTSDPNTGEYQAIFYNNSNIDMLVFNKADLSVRYRAYGPITPSEFIDLPVNI